MAATSLAKLQCMVDKLSKENIELKDKLAKSEEQNRSLISQITYLENHVEDKIKKAVEEAIKQVKEIYEKQLKEKDQRIFELECRLNINSETSSLPSSKNPIDKPKIPNSREKTDKKIGGQIGHKKNKLEKFIEEEITETVIHQEECCSQCHSKKLKIIGEKERDELDFEIIVKKIRHKFLISQCEECGKINSVEIPEYLHAENQYGKNVKTFILMLYNYGFVSYKRVRDFMLGITNGEISPSEGYMVKLQQKVAQGLTNFLFDIGEEIKKAKLVQWDDTVIRIGEKEKACLRVYTDRHFVLFKAHLSKNTEGMDEDGILQNLKEDTVVMHDHLLHNYCKDYHYQNAECNAHITRKLKGNTENTNHNWSDEMKALLLNTLDARNKKISEHINFFTEEEQQEIFKKYDEIVSSGFQEYQEFQHKYEYEREENLLEFLRDYKENILFWIKDFSIPFSNNFVEALLRMIKSKMKISYQFKNLDYAQYFASIRSYTETCRLFEISPAYALKRLFDGNPYTVEELLALKNSQNS